MSNESYKEDIIKDIEWKIIKQLQEKVQIFVDKNFTLSTYLSKV